MFSYDFVEFYNYLFYSKSNFHVISKSTDLLTKIYSFKTWKQKKWNRDNWDYIILRCLIPNIIELLSFDYRLKQFSLTSHIQNFYVCGCIKRRQKIFFSIRTGNFLIKYLSWAVKNSASRFCNLDILWLAFRL